MNGNETKMKNILLIGMPGAGKSSVGVILAKTLGMGFVDTDLIIQNKSGKLLQDIIEHDGLEKFLIIEEKAMLSVKCMNTVIATGGSAVYSNKGMLYLKMNSLTFYLKLPFEEIEQRINNITTRGIAKQKGKSLYDIYLERIPLYEKYADKIIDCSDKSLEVIVGK